MKKESFIVPSIEITKFVENDILTDSVGGGNQGGGGIILPDDDDM